MGTPVRLLDVESFERNIRLRMPFRFGVVTLTACPQVVVRARVSVGEGEFRGLASELLLPKWFDKSPELSEADNVDQLRWSLTTAESVYRDAGRRPTPFALHAACVEPGLGRCGEEGLNPLVAGFGTALIDRAVIDAVCRSLGVSFFDAVSGNLLGIDDSLTPELSDFDFDGFLKSLRPSTRIQARHTVGLVDPLTAEDLSERARPADPLPCTLEECIAYYGSRYFKIKLCGRKEADLTRLSRIASVLDRLAEPYYATLDGNEQYGDAESVVDLWDSVESAPALKRLSASILLIEQPIARAKARSMSVSSLARKRPVEIDESDGTHDAFLWARDLGYRGVSSKSCKGVYRALLNRARCEYWNAIEPSARYFMSAEDLVVQPGISLQQDLSLATLIGSTHIERNGHHYVNGMAHAPEGEQERFRAAYPRLYRRDPDGVVRLSIREGAISLEDLRGPEFGSRVEPDWASFTGTRSFASPPPRG